jgi:ABC-type amino acid transport substrate-binding protein
MKVYPVAAWFVHQTPGLHILAQVPNAPQPLGIGFNRDNPGLIAAVNDALREMQQDKSFQVLTRRWGLL